MRPMIETLYKTEDIPKSLSAIFKSMDKDDWRELFRDENVPEHIKKHIKKYFTATRIEEFIKTILSIYKEDGSDCCGLLKYGLYFFKYKNKHIKNMEIYSELEDLNIEKKEKQLVKELGIFSNKNTDNEKNKKTNEEKTKIPTEEKTLPEPPSEFIEEDSTKNLNKENVIEVKTDLINDPINISIETKFGFVSFMQVGIENENGFSGFVFFNRKFIYFYENKQVDLDFLDPKFIYRLFKYISVDNGIEKYEDNDSVYIVSKLISSHSFNNTFELNIFADNEILDEIDNNLGKILFNMFQVEQLIEFLSTTDRGKEILNKIEIIKG